MAAYALLVGISEFVDPRLAKLNAPKSDVEAFANVLRDPARGGFDSVVTCIDQELQAIRDQLAALLDDRNPDDMVLLFYSGHGIMTKGQRLFLATGQTSFDRPQARSLAAVEMRDMLEQTRAGKQVVILDCCHSGAFVDGAKGVAQTVTGDTFSSDNAEGQYVLTATDALQFAYDATGALRESEVAPSLSRFTGWLVDAIGKGEAAPDKDRITLDAVFDYLSRRARVEAAGMTPKRFVKRNSGEMVIAKNPAAQPAKLPDEVIAQLDSKDWQVRRDAVVALGKLAEQPDVRALAEKAVVARIGAERDVDVREAMLTLLRRLGTAPPEPRSEVPSPTRHGGMPASTSRLAKWGSLAAGIVVLVLGGSYGLVSLRSGDTPTVGADAAVEQAQQQAAQADAARQAEAQAAQQREAEATRQKEAEAAKQREAEAAAARQREAEAEAARQREADAAQKTAIMEIQRELMLTGFYSGAVDGTLGRATIEALIAFQKRAGLPANGKADDATLEKLKQVVAAQAAARSEVASLTPAQTARARAAEAARRREDQLRDNPGSEFKDCAECPSMITVPAGSVTMGSATSESGRDRDESPQHRATIAKNFAVGKYEVTFAEWDACAADGGCNGYRPPDEGWGRGTHPVVNVSWNDAQSYIGWLRRKTGKPYRLLSESEWEYAARANTVSAYYWGARAGSTMAKFSAGDGTAPVGSYVPNSFGLYDMSGNVSEWAVDCLNRSYGGAPTDGSAWTTGDCDLRALRGGAWNSSPDNLRSANRDWDATGFRVNRNGFRVARGF